MTEKENIEAGKRLKKVRKHFGMSQAEMAEKLGLSQPNYCQYERGSRKIGIGLLRRLGDGLCVDSRWIAGAGDSMLREDAEKPESGPLGEILETAGKLNSKYQRAFAEYGKTLLRLQQEEDN